jgi:signal transduction histidine kinase
MTAPLFKASGKKANPAPHRLIIAIICALCLALLASSLFSFTTLSRLRAYYLANRGHEIAAAVESQVRGPGRRSNPEFWQSILETNLESYSASVAFLALLDQKGRVLASAGDQPSGPAVSKATDGGTIYLFEEALLKPRNPRGEASPATAGWRIRVGLRSSNTDFIQRVAFLQLIVSGLAIAALVVLSVYLIRMLNRFLELKARESAEAQLKSLGIMAASLAHEIRNPLGAMKGLTQLAQEELPSDHTAQTQLRTVVSEAERLEKLVTDLLDFARAKEPQISTCNVSELFSNIQAMLQSKLDAAQASVRFSADPDPFYLKTDPAGLRQVLLNVLMNAIEATPANGVIQVSARRSEDAKTAVIRIDDPGKGLGQKDPKELFEPFVTTKARGTGLGLAISRQVAESLGGTLNLENLPQGGARCSILLPRQ